MAASELSSTFITLGGLMLLGLATDFIGRRTPLPRVTLLIVFGFALGPAGFDLLPSSTQQWFPLIADMALLMVGFLLGGKLATAYTPGNGRLIFWISLSEMLVTVAVLAAGLVLVGAPLEVALLLAGIGAATDPVATADVIDQTKAQGSFTETLTGIVAIDDAWGLIAFSVLLAVAHSVAGHAGFSDALTTGALELGGAVALGIALGLPMAFLSGRLRPGQPTLVEALGIVLLCGGVALWLEVSFLLTAMVLGLVVAKRARHHQRPFHAIENIEWPFMILFFVQAGASIQFGALQAFGTIGIAYIAFRTLGRLLGGWPGGLIGKAPATTSRWIGLALLPQAGVAMGMALIAAQQFPQLTETIVPVVVVATVLFEVTGAMVTRLALVRIGEASR